MAAKEVAGLRPCVTLVRLQMKRRMRVRSHHGIGGLLAIVASAVALPAVAQIGGIQQQQLENGFLREQNYRTIGRDFTDTEIYIRRAVDALSAGDFKRSLAILRPYRMGATYTDLLISGLAHAGLGHYDAARKDYKGALRKRRNFIAAQAALGELEASHGDKNAALKVLQELTARRDACSGSCPDQPELSGGVDRINAALQARPSTAP